MKRYIIAILAMWVLVACSATTPSTAKATAPATNATPTSEQRITLGAISGEPAKVIAERQEFMNYLATTLSDYGIVEGDVKVTTDMNVMGEWLASGEVDFMMDSFYPATIVSDISGANPILFRQRDREDKKSIIFARTDSGINTLDQLSGYIIVLEEPDSNSGFLLPIYYLLEAGLNPVEKNSVNDDVSDDEVGYVFSYDDDAILQWVLAGRAIGGAAQSNNYEDFAEDNADQLVSLIETEPIIRDQPLVVSAKMSDEMQQALKDILLRLSDSEEGEIILEELETARFSELSAERQKDFDRAQEMYDLLKERGF